MNNVNWKLFTKYLTNEATQEEKDTVERLLQEEYYRELMHKLENGLNQKRWIKSPFNLQRGLTLLNYKISNQKQINTISRDIKTGPRYLRYWPVAAAIALIISAVFVFNLMIKNTTEPPISLITQETVAGQKKRIELADGTIVHLNAQSYISYPQSFAEENRLLEASGEVYLEVAEDPDRPFILNFPQLTIKVIGTAFNVNNYKAQNTEVSVVHGKVEVSERFNQQEITTLVKGQQLDFDHQNGSHIIAEIAQDEMIEWIYGVLKFNNEALAQVAERLERWYGVKIIFENELLKNCRLTGEFENEPLVELFRTLEISGDFDYKIEKDTVYLSGHGCKSD